MQQSNDSKRSHDIKRNLVGWRPQWPSTTSSCAKPWKSSMSAGPPISAFSVPGGKLFGASSSWFSGARGSPGRHLPVVGSQGWEAAASAVVAATEPDWAAAGLVRSMQVRAARMIHARREAMVVVRWLRLRRGGSAEREGKEGGKGFKRRGRERQRFGLIRATQSHGGDPLWPRQRYRGWRLVDS